MMPEERRYKIVSLLYEERRATVTELCRQLNASEATVRRDLSILENEGKLERVHGGAIIKSNMPLDMEESFGEKEWSNQSQKRLIAEKAFTHLRDHESIFLDGGTTTLELAKLIGRSRIKLNVFTNAPTISAYIAKNEFVELFLVGGKVRNNTLAIVGQMAIDTIRLFRLDKVFIGVNGISIDYGLTTQNFEEAQMKKAVLERGRERIILADSTKFDKVALCQVLPITAVDEIITSKVEDAELKEALNQNGIRLTETE